MRFIFYISFLNILVVSLTYHWFANDHSPTYEVGGFANVLDQFVYVNTFWVILGFFFKAEHVVKIFEGRLTQ